jgi:hypothetical protein
MDEAVVDGVWRAGMGFLILVEVGERRERSACLSKIVVDNNNLFRERDVCRNGFGMKLTKSSGMGQYA